MINSISIEGTVEGTTTASTKTGLQIVKLKINQRKTYREKLTIQQFEITCFGDASQVALYQVKKHDNVLVQGRLDSRVNEYKGKEYVNVSIVANQIFVSPAGSAEPKIEAPNDSAPSFTEEDLPF